jgi:hypothetical protein
MTLPISLVSTSLTTLITNSFGSRSTRKKLRDQLASTLGNAYEDLDAAFRALIAECDLKAYDARAVTKAWASAYYCIGLPATILAAVSGATGLASQSGRIAAGIIALVAAGFAATVTFLDSESKRKENDSFAAGWQSLAEKARLTFLAVRRAEDWKTSDESMETLVALNSERDTLLRRVVRSPVGSGETHVASQINPSQRSRP